MQPPSFPKIPFPTRSVLPLMTVAALAASGLSNAAVLAAWDDWAEESTSPDADTTLAGFSGVITTVEERVFTSTFGSNDGTYGTVAGAETPASALLLRRGGSSSGVTPGADTATLTITNNTGSAYTVDSFHFDFGVRASGSSQSGSGFEFTYVSGGLGPASTLIADQNGFSQTDGSGNLADLHDLDFTLATFLSDTTLADGESATFTLQVTDFASNSASSVLDNIAFQGTAVPEPSVVALGLIGILGLLRRRRH